MIKTYKVQTWNSEGALTNSYLADVNSTAELEALKKFLKKTSAHVVLTLQPPKPAKAKR